jgi:D-glycero-alpha-D-manno-heptose-7-phosphate kinase
MIISRTPFRISFVGGGTDLPSFYLKEPGQVLSTAIDKYIYVVVKRQIGIVEFKYRVNWSKVEFRNSIDDIEHPIVREALKMMGIDFPIEITTFADIPSNTGLGSSSAFTVGLLHALYALKGEMVTKYTLASRAAYVEMVLLKRNMGKQDHFASAYGGINTFTFMSNDDVLVEPVFYSPLVRDRLEQNLLLFYTTLKRDASEVLAKQSKNTEDKRQVLRKMKDLVPLLRGSLSNIEGLDEVGNILDAGWQLKRTITDEISSEEIDEHYDAAKKAGATGGKLLGAGGGGFLLFYADPKNHEKISKAMNGLFKLKFGLDTGGSRITYYDQAIVN